MAYLAAPVITTSLFMLWDALGGSFHLRDFPFLLLVFCIPHLLGTLLWIPFLLSRDSRRFGRLFYLGAGAGSGFLTAALASLLLGKFLSDLSGIHDLRRFVGLDLSRNRGNRRGNSLVRVA